MKMSSRNIKVAIKARPILKKEKDAKLSSQWKIVENSIRQTESQSEPFYFDHIFDQEVSNRVIFNTVAKPIVEAAFQGFNGTIFAYGQTCSGKTYTMLGDEKDPGVMMLAAKEIFKEIELAIERQFLLRIGYIEIYNEKVFDLLHKSNQDLKIHETQNGDVTVNCEEVIITSEDQMIEYLQAGSKHRKMGETNVNERSSRSHAIFRIIIESREVDKPPDEGSVQISNLNLVDLAGSERADQTGATGSRLKEGAHINKSLLYLSCVINKLSENESAKFINYRDSKLTRILQASLGGNALTAIICNINPTAIDETTSTLSFAMRAKAIKNKPHVNEVLSDAALMKRLEKEIARLESELQVERTKNSKIKIVQLEKQIHEEELKIVHSHAQVSKKDIFRRRTWSACVNTEKTAEDMMTANTESETTLSKFPVSKMMTPLITLRNHPLSPLEELKPTDNIDFVDFSVDDPQDVLKTPEVFKNSKQQYDSPIDISTRCKMVEQELEELFMFTNLEKKYNVEHDLIACLKGKLEDAQQRIKKYQDEYLHIQLEEWNEREGTLNRRCIYLENQIKEQIEILNTLKKKDESCENKLRDAKQQIKNLQLELSEKNSMEFELEHKKHRKKVRENELLEALSRAQNSEQDIRNLNKKCEEYEQVFEDLSKRVEKLYEEKEFLQKENNELSMELMEALQESDSLKNENCILHTEVIQLNKKISDDCNRRKETMLPQEKDASSSNVGKFENMYDERNCLTSMSNSSEEFSPENLNRKILSLDLELRERIKENNILKGKLAILEEAKLNRVDNLHSLGRINETLEKSEIEIISDLKIEVSALRSKQKLTLDENIKLTTEISFLDEQLKQNRNENNDLREQIQHLEVEKNECLLKLNSMKALEMSLKEEIEKLNEKIIFLKENSSLKNVSSFEIYLSKKSCEKNLNDPAKKLDQVKKDCMNELINLEPFDDSNIVLTADIRDINMQISNYLDTIANLNLQITFLQHQIKNKKILSVVKQDEINISPISDGNLEITICENIACDKVDDVQMSRITEIKRAPQIEAIDEILPVQFENIHVYITSLFESLSIKFLDKLSLIGYKTQQLDQKLKNFQQMYRLIITDTEKSNQCESSCIKDKGNHLSLTQLSKDLQNQVIEKLSEMNNTIEDFVLKIENMEILRDKLKDQFEKYHFKLEAQRKEAVIVNTMYCNRTSEHNKTISLNQKLREELRSMKTENDKLKDSIYKQESLSNNENLATQKEYKCEKDQINTEYVLIKKSNENLQTKLTCQKDIITLNKMIVESNNKFKDLQVENNLLHSENNRLKSDYDLMRVISEKFEYQLKMVNESKINLTHIMEELNCYIKVAKEENILLSTETNNLRSRISAEKDINTKLIEELHFLKHNGSLLENRIHQFEINAEQNIEEKNNLNDKLKKSIEKNESLLNEVKTLKELKNELERKCDRCQEENVNLKKVITESNSLIKQTEEECKVLTLSTDSLADNVMKLEQERNSLLVGKEEFENEIFIRQEKINRLSAEIIDLKSQNITAIKKLQNLEQEFCTAETKCDYKTLCMSLETDFKTINRDLQQCEMQNKELQSKNDELIAKINHMEEQNKQFMKNLKDLQQCERNNKELQSKHDELIVNINNMEEQNKQLVKNLRDLQQCERKNEELQSKNDELIAKTNNMEEQNMQLVKNLRDFQQCEGKNKELQSKNDELIAKLNNMEEQNKQLMKTLENAESQLSKLISEQNAVLTENRTLLHEKLNVKYLESEIEEKSNHINNLESQIESILNTSNEIKALKLELDIRNKECSNLQAELNIMTVRNKNLESIKQLVERSQNQFNIESIERKKYQNKVEELTKELKKLNSEYNSCLVQIRDYNNSNLDDHLQRDSQGDTKRNVVMSPNKNLLKQLHEMQKMHLFKTGQLQSKIDLLEARNFELFQKLVKSHNTISKERVATKASITQGPGRLDENPLISVHTGKDNLNTSADGNKQKEIIKNLLGENKQLKIKYDKLIAEVEASRKLSQQDRKSRRQSTHDEKRQILWEYSRDVGIMTQPTDQLCNCEELNIKVNELKKTLKIKECQINTLFSELKSNPLKDDNEKLKRLLSEEEAEERKLRIEISKLKQTFKAQINEKTECPICLLNSNKIYVHKPAQTDKQATDYSCEEIDKVQRKCDDLKKICRMRREKIEELEAKINKEKENEVNNQQNINERNTSETLGNYEKLYVSLKKDYDILSMKYEQSKVICISRREEIRSLEEKLNRQIN